MNNDLISREALKEEMKIAHAKAIDYETVVDMYEKLVDNAPTVQLAQDRWITVSERLPEEDADYEITLNNKQVTIDHAVDGKFMFHNGDAIAWQPLPEPYEKGGAEE